MPETTNDEAKDLINLPLKKGFYFDCNSRLFSYFTGEYNHTGDPIFELQNWRQVYMDKELVRKWYFAVADPEHFIDFINNQLPWIKSKLEELTQVPTEKILETTVPFALSHSFSEERTEEMEEYVIDSTLPFDDPARYDYRPKQLNQDNLPF